MDIRHTPNLLPTTLSGINACLDHAHFIPPWPIPTDAPATGGVSWKIPYTWKVLNIGAAHPNSFDLTQEFKLSAGGAAKVKKGPAEVERNQSEP